jgi:hypothetical protein
VNYYQVRKGGLNTAANVEVSLYPEDFLKFIKNHGLTDIYLVEKDDPFVVRKDIVKKSRCNYFFAATHDNVICFLDAMGFSNLESLEESIQNRSFYAIQRIKDTDNSDYWKEDTGTIYEDLSEKGYNDDTKIRNAYRFLEENIDIMTYDEFLQCEARAKDGSFRTLHEICISKQAGFRDRYDYEEARELMAPDIQSLDAHRLLEEIQDELDYDNMSESLIAGVIVHLATENEKNVEGETFIDLTKIYNLYRHWQPEKPREELNRFKKEEDIDTFLQSSKGRLLGYYSPSNRQYQFSFARIYIDGANVAFKGAKRGDGSKGLNRPDISVLTSCYDKIQNESFGPVKIIFDGLVAKHILNEDAGSNRKLFDELKKARKLELTIMGETADDVLIQKMRDDPHAYIVVNDDYSKDHHLTERDLEQVINIRFIENMVEFYGIGFEKLKKRSSLFTKLNGCGPLLFNLKKLGVWSYEKSTFRSPDVSGRCCL